MFDDKNLNLTFYSTVTQSLGNKILDFRKEGLLPLITALQERYAYEWNRKANIEVGRDRFILEPNDSGGWQWKKFDPETQNLSQTTESLDTEIEELLLELLSSETERESSFPSDKIDEDESISDTEPTIKLRFSHQNLEPQHEHELVEGSAIDPEIAELNFRSLEFDHLEQEHEAWSHLMYSNNLERINSGRLSTGILNRYEHLNDGGWWCRGGVDPCSFANLESGQKPETKLWGCFKPNNPRIDFEKNKPIKYEHPPKTDLSIFLLDVPDRIAVNIYQKNGINPSESDLKSGFWYCVWKHNIRITITEGAKKAASLLSQGEAAIGLPGINAGYRSRDNMGNPLEPKLHKELAVFATPQREVKICFDYEPKLKTKRNIDIATYRTGKLFEANQAKVSVIKLPGPEKGVDDFIVSQGTQSFNNISALPLDEWWRTHEPPNIRLTIFLKNGEQKRLYEQKSDGTVTVDSALSSYKKNTQSTPLMPKDIDSEVPRSTSFISAPTEDVPLPEVDNLETKEENSQASAISPNLTDPAIDSSDLDTQSTYSWADDKSLPRYKQTSERKSLDKRQDYRIARTAKKLLINYGLPQDNGLVYQSDAFTIKSISNNYTIYRQGEKSPLMKFKTNKLDEVKSVTHPTNMLRVERMEFLAIADRLKKEQLPSVDDDTRKIASKLGSLSPLGTHQAIETSKKSEVLQILIRTLDQARTNELKIGKFTVKAEKDKLGKSFLRLLKQEHDGTTREVACYEIDKTTDRLTHDVKVMALNDLDIQNLRSLSQNQTTELPSSALDNILPDPGGVLEHKDEVMKILINTLNKARRDELSVGDFTIKAQRSEEPGKSHLMLFKAQQEVVRFELTQNLDSTSKELKFMNISEDDLQNLRALSKKLQLESLSANTITNTPSEENSQRSQQIQFQTSTNSGIDF